jgi:chemotaxis response regulator CheB
MTALTEPGSPRASCARVLAVDDRSAFKDVLCRLVDRAGRLDLLAVADSGESALEAVRTLQPDMVVMDVVMPGIGGAAAARTIKAGRPATVVVLVSTTHPDDLPDEVHECAADAVVWKARLRPQLLEELWFTHRRPPGTDISLPT